MIARRMWHEKATMVRTGTRFHSSATMLMGIAQGPGRPGIVQPTATIDSNAITSAHGPSEGPSVGPSRPPGEGIDLVEKPGAASLSYADSRAAIRNLTMPPVPNFAIPESPPGSPPLRATKKFDKFLELRQQGIRFNQKLESSSALANPTLFQKLMEYAGLDEQSQYASTLSDDLAVPTRFPEWMYADRLNKTQEELSKRKEQEGRGQPRQFVSGGTLEPPSPTRMGRTPDRGSRGQSHASAAERVMEGLENDRRSSSGRRR
jgi:hypothetical protein